MIEIKNLTKRYGNGVALDNVSFTVKSGEILGFLGPNGAGKSTTMNIITGYISATSGTVEIDGHDNVTDSMECRKMIGYLPEIPPLYNDMTVNEYLDFVYDIKKATQPRNEHIASILETVGIKDVASRLIKNLSKGYKQRVGIAQALIGDPQILILDEPTVGLDPKQINEIRNVICELGKNRTIILSSHILPEVSAICDRVIIINKGKIVAEDTPQNLSKKLTNDNKFVIRVSGDKSFIESVISEVPGVEYIESLGQKEDDSYDYIIESQKDCDVRAALFASLSQNNLPILMIKAMDMSLEDIFLQITEEDLVLVEDDNEQQETEQELPDTTVEQAEDFSEDIAEHSDDADLQSDDKSNNEQEEEN